MQSFLYVLSVCYYALKDKLEILKAIESKTDEDKNKIWAVKRFMRLVKFVYNSFVEPGDVETEDESDPPPPGGGNPPPPPKP